MRRIKEIFFFFAAAFSNGASDHVTNSMYECLVGVLVLLLRRRKKGGRRARESLIKRERETLHKFIVVRIFFSFYSTLRKKKVDSGVFISEGTLIRLF